MRSDWFEIGSKIVFEKGWLADLNSDGNLLAYKHEKSKKNYKSSV